jgi:hypothetical protein
MEKKLLPKKITMKMPIAKTLEVTHVKYTPPTLLDNKGHISFLFDRRKLSAPIVLVDRNPKVAQWGIKPTDPIYIDKQLGIGFVKSVSIHEVIERYLQEHYNIPWQPHGHAIAEWAEHKYCRAMHPESDWNKENANVNFIAKSSAGGKLNVNPAVLHTAFRLLSQAKASK